MAEKTKRKTLDANSLKKAAKWFFLDKVVIFSAVLGIILLILTLIVYAQDQGGNEAVSETVVFTIKPYPSLLVIVSLALVGLIGLVFLVKAIKQKEVE